MHFILITIPSLSLFSGMKVRQRKIIVQCHKIRQMQSQDSDDEGTGREAGSKLAQKSEKPEVENYPRSQSNHPFLSSVLKAVIALACA